MYCYALHSYNSEKAPHVSGMCTRGQCVRQPVSRLSVGPYVLRVGGRKLALKNEWLRMECSFPSSVVCHTCCQVQGCRAENIAPDSMMQNKNASTALKCDMGGA